MNCRSVVILAPLLLASCSGDSSSEYSAPSKQVQLSRFENEIAPILQQNCATCHLTGEEAGRMSLVPGRAAESLVNVSAIGAPHLLRVVPGDPDNSYLVMKLEGTQVEHGGGGARMPLAGPPLQPDQIAVIRKWIADGSIQ